MTQSTTETTQYWRELDRRHHLHPFTEYRQLNRTGGRIITRAEGVDRKSVV